MSWWLGELLAAGKEIWNGPEDRVRVNDEMERGINEGGKGRSLELLLRG
jgi:hypothetical protein